MAKTRSRHHSEQHVSPQLMRMPFPLPPSPLPLPPSAQGKRNRRATCATWNCAESSACLCCVCSQSFATEAGEAREKNQTLKSNIIRLG
jgi:hypothetical protein